MTDLVQKIREALAFHAKECHNLPWHDGQVTQWLSEAADEIERLERALGDHGKVSKEKEAP